MPLLGKQMYKWLIVDTLQIPSRDLVIEQSDDLNFQSKNDFGVLYEPIFRVRVSKAAGTQGSPAFL